MKPSILTLLDLTFLGVHVEINPSYQNSAKKFDFEGSTTRWGLRHGKRAEDGTEWWVGVDFGLDSDEEKACPYEINVRAVGRFSVDASCPDEKREVLAFENGAALVFGAIREMVSTVTARAAYGMLILPTATFVGSLAEHNKRKQAKDAEALADSESALQEKKSKASS
jgi:preprotein translocase subunit SecB